jgi:hypothetical protein
MHWLTWREIADFFLRTWQGLGLTVSGVLAGAYYGPRKIVETWDWYLDRFVDDKVLDVIREQALVRPQDRPLTALGTPMPLDGFSVGELATKLDRSQQSIGKSIKRLRKSGKVEFFYGAFRLKE